MVDAHRQKSTHLLTALCVFLSLILFAMETGAQDASTTHSLLNVSAGLEATTENITNTTATLTTQNANETENSADKAVEHLLSDEKSEEELEATEKATTEAQATGLLEVSKSNKTNNTMGAGALEVLKFNQTKKAKGTGGLEASKSNKTMDAGIAAAKLAELEAEESKEAEKPKLATQTAGPPQNVTAESETQIAEWFTTVTAEPGSTMGLIVAVVTVVAIIAIGCCAFFLIKKSKKGKEEDKGKDKIMAAAAKGEQEKLLPEKKAIAIDKQLVPTQNEGNLIPMAGLQANPIAGQPVPAQNEGYVIPQTTPAAGYPLAAQPVIPPVAAKTIAQQPQTQTSPQPMVTR